MVVMSPISSWKPKRLKDQKTGRSKYRLECPQLDLDGLEPGIVFERAGAVLAADARLLVAADRHLRRGLAPTVDPADASFELVDHPMRGAEAFGSQARREAVGRSVGAADHLFLVVEGQQAHDRAED